MNALVKNIIANEEGKEVEVLETFTVIKTEYDFKRGELVLYFGENFDLIFCIKMDLESANQYIEDLAMDGKSNFLGYEGYYRHRDLIS